MLPLRLSWQLKCLYGTIRTNLSVNHLYLYLVNCSFSLFPLCC
uniref:Uncharacterized protein n=1 Tax=Rhizophora mucronata TaxID=61149 RepID=A0A2P2MBI8_RHIMU